MVDLAFDVQARDDSGRLLAYVWADARHANAELVAHGYAAAATRPPNVAHADLRQKREREARETGRGRWSDPEALRILAERSGYADPSTCYSPPPGAPGSGGRK